MKILITITLSLTVLLLGNQTKAEPIPLELDKLSFETVHQVAERSILAKDDKNRPQFALLKLDHGDVLPPHSGNSGIPKLLTVISGELSWGDGSKVDETKERKFQAGTILLVPAEDGEHWAAARNGDVLLQVLLIWDGVLAEEIKSYAQE